MFSYRFSRISCSHLLLLLFYGRSDNILSSISFVFHGTGHFYLRAFTSDSLIRQSGFLLDTIQSMNAPISLFCPMCPATHNPFISFQWPPFPIFFPMTLSMSILGSAPMSFIIHLSI
ncbi:hypothetical protein GUJ93_ZPchr0011g28355 [Zizania palustris]|uniref:Secreted protein n=1 Tax=Zizania palustris TaxID=103762 RepID=A0A8J5WLL2_ZIZPA|nr:hypothetical protein GUJ93_ZPchr0011g28355 [Zizania palustris]